MLKLKSKLVLVEIIALVLIISGGFFTVIYLNNISPDSAKASENSSNNSSNTSIQEENLSPEEKVRKRVRDNPEAGIEAIPAEDLEQTKKLMKTLPKFLIERELDSQLKDGYLTQKQHQELNQLLDEIKQN